MIQRIQTLFLLLAIAAQAFLFFLPLAGYFVGDTAYALNAFGLYDLTGGAETKVLTIPFYIAVGLIIVLLTAQIATFKNRKLQLKIGSFAFIISLLALIPMYYFAITSAQYIPLIANAQPVLELGFGFGMPLIALFFIFLANRAIRKDEELVRSADRLR